MAMKTPAQYLQEAKEQFAKKLSFDSWKHFVETGHNVGEVFIQPIYETAITNAQNDAAKERFTKPTDKQYVDFAIIFNEGKLEREKLADMVAMAELMIDRLYENGDVTKHSSKESIPGIDKVKKKYTCRLDEQQCQEECHGNVESMEKCSCCTVTIIN